MKTSKMSLSNFQNKLNRNEMKNVTGGFFDFSSFFKQFDFMNFSNNFSTGNCTSAGAACTINIFGTTAQGTCKVAGKSVTSINGVVTENDTYGCFS